jgi:hypothetical protein
LERHHITGRVELENTEEGILIRPVHQTDSSESSSQARGGNAEDLITAMDDDRKVGRWHRVVDQVISRFRK